MTEQRDAASSSTPTPDIEILHIETVAAEIYPLRKIRFAQTRRDGTRATLERELLELPQSVVVLPVDRRRGTVLLCRQLRLPAFINGDPPLLLEACAGHVEDGDEPEATVRREAEEELGYRLGALTRLFVLYTSPGATNEKLHHFLAEYDPTLRLRGSGGGLAAEGEDIEIVELTLDEAWAQVTSGQIIDAKTVLLLLQAKLSARREA